MFFFIARKARIFAGRIYRARVLNGRGRSGGSLFTLGIGNGWMAAATAVVWAARRVWGQRNSAQVLSWIGRAGNICRRGHLRSVEQFVCSGIQPGQGPRLGQLHGLIEKVPCILGGVDFLGNALPVVAHTLLVLFPGHVLQPHLRRRPVEPDPTVQALELGHARSFQLTQPQGGTVISRLGPGQVGSRRYSEA